MVMIRYNGRAIVTTVSMLYWMSLMPLMMILTMISMMIPIMLVADDLRCRCPSVPIV